jgi:hypothetical protein
MSQQLLTAHFPQPSPVWRVIFRAYTKAPKANCLTKEGSFDTPSKSSPCFFLSRTQFLPMEPSGPIVCAFELTSSLDSATLTLFIVTTHDLPPLRVTWATATCVANITPLLFSIAHPV